VKLKVNLKSLMRRIWSMNPYYRFCRKIRVGVFYRKGIVKRTNLKEYSNIELLCRAINLDENDTYCNC